MIYRALTVLAFVGLVLTWLPVSTVPSFPAAARIARDRDEVRGACLFGRARPNARGSRARPDVPQGLAGRAGHAVRLQERTAGRVLDEEHLRLARHDLHPQPTDASCRLPRTPNRCRNGWCRPAGRCGACWKWWRVRPRNSALRPATGWRIRSLPANSAKRDGMCRQLAGPERSVYREAGRPPLSRC